MSIGIVATAKSSSAFIAYPISDNTGIFNTWCLASWFAYYICIASPPPAIYAYFLPIAAIQEDTALPLPIFTFSLFFLND